MIEHVKELDPELGVEPLLEREVLEYGEIHVLEARVAEDIPAHGAEGTTLGRNQNRFTAYVAASFLQRTGVWGHRRTLRSQRRGKSTHDAAHPGLRRTKHVLAAEVAVGDGARAGF